MMSLRDTSTERILCNNISRTVCSVSQSTQTTCKNQGSQSSIISDSTELVCRNYKGHQRCTFSTSWRHTVCRSPEACRECVINQLAQTALALYAVHKTIYSNFLDITNMSLKNLHVKFHVEIVAL
jgi:hypothetical protein